ncbi:hypothetical protein FOZ63_000153 [Perkinsus olseni]|uniref:Uncharacterized protein n=1 Tax=Perkinsus olseni TaxID=32597 RepID=A0A7J6N7D6_PEROL|nr:hypothetical protein FOZ63_000153 [Perkinsus olseni]KAF4720935.1 hypothetical protein FOZ62_008416 [Perkinsus olseni]
MLPSGYSDADSSSSSSDSEIDPPEELTTKRQHSPDSSSSSSSEGSEQDEGDAKAVSEGDAGGSDEAKGEGSGLPSFNSIFNAVGEDDLTYKKFVASKSRKIAPFDLAEEREVARRRAAEQKRIEEVHQVTDGEKPLTKDIGQEGNGSPGNRPTFNSMSKRERHDAQRYSTKDRTRLKRFKGQSGEDHAGRSWKPDVWMKMRNEYD